MFDAGLTTPMRLRYTAAAQAAQVESFGPATVRRQRAMDVYTPLDPAQVLVSMLLPIGDTLLATPAVTVLRKRFPLAKITVLASRSNAGILRDNPNIDQLILTDDPAEATDSKMLRLARGLSELRQTKYDLVINLSPVGGLVLMMAGVYQKPLTVEKPVLWWPLSEEERQPRLYATAKDRASARRVLRERGLSPAHLLVTMHVGGDGFNGRKRWAPKRFAEVAARLIERFDAHVLLVGGPADVPMCEEVAALVGRGVTILAGATTLKETAALIELSAVFVGNDSCPLHIAAAVGTPAVGVFGPSNAEQFRPIGKRGYRQRIVRSELPCSPCFHFIGNDAPWVPNTCYSFACLKSISAEQVLDAAVELLRDTRDPGPGVA
jgi:ADP-heptose:LPS heptosyltransferase